MSSTVEPFKIAVSDKDIDLLKKKLALATYADEVDFSDDWSYGAPRSDVQRLAAYWKDGFDWRAQEAKLNEVPQFTTNVHIDGHGELNIHFVHQKSAKPDSIPLLFCHGWPGSFLEVIKILPYLTDAEDGPTFHVVAPSLPNFGFSGRTPKKGFSSPQYAEAMHKVMLNLGYNKYVTQGGDWGFIITRLMGILYPEHCLANHVNYVRIMSQPSFATSPFQWLKHAITPYTEFEKAGVARSNWFKELESGYRIEQATKPSTLGFALSDSPISLLAWIYEKLRGWTDNYPWTDDEILTWISIYQFSTAGPAASVRIYYEGTHSQRDIIDKGSEYVPGVKLGLSYFAKDVILPPKAWGRTLGEVVFEAEHAAGGHFAAHECPEVLANDVKTMFDKSGGAYTIARQFKSA